MSRLVRKNSDANKRPAKKAGVLLVVLFVGMMSFGSSFIRPAAAGWSDVAIIAAIVGFKTVFVTLLNSVLGGFDALNQQITKLFQLQTNADTKQTQAKLDADLKLAQSKILQSAITEKSTTDQQLTQACIEFMARWVANDMQVFADAAKQYLSQHPFTFVADGVSYNSSCFGQGSGHASGFSDTPGKSGGCQGGVRGMGDRLKVGCAIGALDAFDVKGTQIGGISCKTDLFTAYGSSRNLAADPDIFFMRSVFLPSGSEPVAGNNVVGDPHIGQLLFQNQMFAYFSLLNNEQQLPITSEITSSPDAVAAYHRATSHELEQRRARASLAMDAIVQHAAVPCDLPTGDNFKEICANLKLQCGNFKTLMGDKALSAYPGCANGTGQVSPDETDRMWSEACANVQAAKADASGLNTQMKDVQSQIRFCSQWDHMAKNNRRRMQEEMKAALIDQHR